MTMHAHMHSHVNKLQVTCTDPTNHSVQIDTSMYGKDLDDCYGCNNTAPHAMGEAV